MKKIFKTEIKIPFGDCDPAGILYFANILNYSHKQFEEFIEFIGISWTAWFQQKDYLIPIRHCEVNFLAPFFPGKKYQVTATVGRIGESSFQMIYEFQDAKTVCAKVAMVHAFMDAKSKKKTLIPTKIKKKLQPYLLRSSK